jgi:hypothetical protein
VGTNHSVILAITLPNGQSLTQTATLTVGVLDVATGPGYNVNGTIVVPDQGGSGTMTMEVHDDTINDDTINTFSIMDIAFATITVHSTTAAGNSTVDVANITGLVLTHNGSPVSPADLLAPWQ